MQRVILHIDFDSFFASVAQQQNPKLRNRPIGVTATNGRTCIIAASREAKRYGVRSPSNTYDAQKICPTIQFISADFVTYWEIAKKFVAIAKDYSPFVEVFSIDELFMDITQSVHLFKNKENLISIIKRRIATELGMYITVSVGISYNKMLAKMASGLQKPNGIVEITPENVWDIYQKAKLTDICGIGHRISLRLHKIGVYSLLQLKDMPIRFLIAEFGPSEAQFLKNIGLAIDESLVIPYTEVPQVKSVGRQYCLPKNEYDQHVVLQNIYELCEEIGIKLRRLKKVASTVGLFLRGEKNASQRKTIVQYMDTGGDIFSVCKFLYDTWQWRGYVRMMGVWAENLEDKVHIPSSLFDPIQRNEKLLTVIDAINEKFGDHTIRNGSLLYADKLTTMPNGFLADRYERVKLAKEELL